MSEYHFILVSTNRICNVCMISDCICCAFPASVCICPSAEASVKQQKASGCFSWLSRGSRVQKRSLYFPVSKSFRRVFFCFPAVDPPCQEILRGGIPSCSLLHMCAPFHSELGGGRGLRQGGVWTSDAHELAGDGRRRGCGPAADGHSDRKQCKQRSCVMLSAG